MKKKYAVLLPTFVMAFGLLALSALAEGLDTQIPGAGMSVVLNQYYEETDDPQTEIAAMLDQVSDLEISSQAEDEEETAAEETDSETEGEAEETEETEEETDPLMAYYDTIVISQVSDSSYVNVRTEPNTESEIVGKLYDNCAATIVSEEDGWYKIQSGTVEGYVKASYFITGDEARELALELGEVVATVTANILNVRADQGTDETWLTILEYGTEVEVLEYGDNWVKVAVDDDLVGWVSADYVDIRVDFDTAISLEEEEQQLAEEAERLQAYEDAMAKLAQSEETTTEQTTTEETTTTKAAETTTTAAETTTTAASSSDGVTFTSTNDTIYATANVYIRSSYSTSSTKIAKVSSGTALTRTGIGSNGWDRVSYNGGTYYVYAKYFTTTEPTTTTTTTTAQTTTKSEETTTTTTTTSSSLDDLRAAVVAYALQFVGNPYVYGGTSLTNGTDCSGFTMSVYAHFGISICHSSKGQVNYGIAVNVSESDLLPGDLLFYSNDGSTIGHVALYIGNGQVVHASTAKTGIKISTWNYRTPVAARRLIY